MKKKLQLSVFFVQLTFCMTFTAFALYSFLTMQNRCTELKMQLPKVAKEIEKLKQENAHLHYQIECFESPDHLLGLAQMPEFSHLKFPLLQDILTLKEGLAVQWETSADTVASSKSKRAIVVAAKN